MSARSEVIPKGMAEMEAIAECERLNKEQLPGVARKAQLNSHNGRIVIHVTHKRGFDFDADVGHCVPLAYTIS